jgi:hypothetical protein
MDRNLVISVQVLIYAVLFHYKDFCTDTKKLVQFIDGKFPEKFLVKDEIHSTKLRNKRWTSK